MAFYQKVDLGIGQSTGEKSATQAYMGLFTNGGLTPFHAMKLKEGNFASGSTLKKRRRRGGIEASDTITCLPTAEALGALLAMLLGAPTSTLVGTGVYKHVYGDGTPLRPVFRDRWLADSMFEVDYGGITSLQFQGEANDDLPVTVGFMATGYEYAITNASSVLPDLDTLIDISNAAGRATVFTFKPDYSGSPTFDLTDLATNLNLNMSRVGAFKKAPIKRAPAAGSPRLTTFGLVASTVYDFGLDDDENPQLDLIRWFMGDITGTGFPAEQAAPKSGTIHMKWFGEDITTGKPYYMDVQANCELDIPDLKKVTQDALDRTGTVTFNYLDSIAVEMQNATEKYEAAAS